MDHFTGSIACLDLCPSLSVFSKYKRIMYFLCSEPSKVFLSNSEWEPMVLYWFTKSCIIWHLYPHNSIVPIVSLFILFQPYWLHYCFSNMSSILIPQSLCSPRNAFFSDIHTTPPSSLQLLLKCHLISEVFPKYHS